MCPSVLGLSCMPLGGGVLYQLSVAASVYVPLGSGVLNQLYVAASVCVPIGGGVLHSFMLLRPCACPSAVGFYTSFMLLRPCACPSAVGFYTGFMLLHRCACPSVVGFYTSFRLLHPCACPSAVGFYTSFMLLRPCACPSAVGFYTSFLLLRWRACPSAVGFLRQFSIARPSGASSGSGLMLGRVPPVIPSLPVASSVTSPKVRDRCPSLGYMFRHRVIASLHGCSNLSFPAPPLRWERGCLLATVCRASLRNFWTKFVIWSLWSCRISFHRPTLWMHQLLLAPRRPASPRFLAVRWSGIGSGKSLTSRIAFVIYMAALVSHRPSATLELLAYKSKSAI